MKKNIYRTHNCNELTIKNVGEEVVVSGFVTQIRKMGGLCFVVLRDHFGLLQLVVREEGLVANISRESVVKASGVVIERESKNPNMQTGEIEIETSKIEVLSKCTSALPFEIENSTQTKEDLRIKYRYLDLRNSKLHSNIVKRSEILNFVRNKMHNDGFVEVQTPILTSSSPEGARDYIVPTINAPGQFYALPQAPQQFKQLLMVSNFDRYFQIAPCFRNEEARADRLPGEFYQIDFEMAYATQEDVFEVAEDVAHSIYTNFSNFDVCPRPFKRISYKDAAEKYCSDKPDLRNPLLVYDYTTCFEGVELGMFKDVIIKGVKVDCKDKSRKFYDAISQEVVKYEGKGIAWVKKTADGFVGSIAKFIDQSVAEKLDAVCKIEDGESIIFVYDANKGKMKTLGNTIRTYVAEQLDLIDKNKVEFCWIVDFPFYEFDEENNKIDFSHNPFSMPQGGLEALQTKKPLEINAYQYDLVCNGYEMLSGAVRNNCSETMEKAFEIAGYGKEVVQEKFAALYEAFSFGAPPHAGGALGFDRMLMPILDATSIREVVAFPMNKSGKDLLMNAPGNIDDKTLAELGLATIKKEK